MIRKIIGLSLLLVLVAIGASYGKLLWKDFTYLNGYDNISKLSYLEILRSVKSRS